MENNVEIKQYGLVCDNKACDWKDDTITIEQMDSWLNKPCPKCGENVLTEEDYNNLKILVKATELINLIDMPKKEGEQLYQMKVGTHKGITIEEISPVPPHP